MSTTNPHSNRGFALLITITLLAFLVLLLVSLASLTRVETRVADNNQKLSTARQNALVGLNIAIGQLQRHAGPDLRLTTTAEITSPATNKHFTGIWTPLSSSGVPSAGGVPALTTWLVSGNEGADPLAVTPTNAPDPTTAASASEVFLVDEGSVDTLADRVKLPKRAIQVAASSIPGAGATGNATIGHYAYWVGDEGVKVSTSLHDQTDDLTYDNSAVAVAKSPPAPGDNWSDADKRARLRQLALPRPRTEKIFAGLNPDDASTRDGLSRMLTSAQLPFVSSSVTPANLKARFHHATALSEAVFVDLSSGTGRLRLDYSDTPDLPTGAKQGALPTFLRTRPDSVEGLQATYSLKRAHNSNMEETEFPLFSLAPILTEFAVRFQFYRNSAGNLSIMYDIQAELWNPYAASLTIPEGGLRVRIGGLPTSSTHSQVKLTEVAGETRSFPATTFAPGQIRVFWSGPTGMELAASDTLPTKYESTLGPINAGAKISINKGDKVYLRVTTYLPDAEGEPTEVNLMEYRIAPFTSTNVTVVDYDTPAIGIGYAHALRDDMTYWMDGSKPSRDPRRNAGSTSIQDGTDPYWSPGPKDNYLLINQAGMDPFSATRRLAIFDLPRQEVISIGALQHVSADQSYKLGNSWGGAYNKRFDNAFFSTLPRSMTWDPTDPPPLPNPYVRIHLAPDAPPPPVGDPLGVNSPTSDYLLDYTHAAKYLMQHGAFNINSTSIPAWTAVLSGVRIPDWRHVDGEGVATTALDNAFFRLPNGGQELDADPTENEPTNEYLRGVRTLKDEEVEEVTQLATAIVNILKERAYPFPTLHRFLTTEDATLRLDDSVIAKAIAAVPTINQGLTAHSSGWLSQADVLTLIAPFITPRSDTFLVRAYGDVQNPASGGIDARAWCEAIVQRLPELTEPVSGVTDPAIDPLKPDPAKYPFGRRFKIISFRWLSDSDI